MNKLLGNLIVRLGLDPSDFDKGLNSAKGTLDKARTSMSVGVNSLGNSFTSLKASIFSVQGAIVALGSAAVVGGIMKTVQAYLEAEQAVVKLQGALKATGRYSQEAVAKIQESATAIQRVTTYGDDAIVEATATLAKFAKKLSASELADAQKAVVGLANTLRLDLNSAALLLGKTLQSNNNVLKRYGIEIDTTKSQHDKLNQVLKQTETFFQGAQAEAQSTEGRAKQLNEAWGDLLETIGQTAVAGTDAANGLNTTTKAVIWLTQEIQNNQSAIARIIKFIGLVAVLLGKAVVGVASAMGGAIVGVVGGMTKVIEIGLTGINDFLKETTKAINATIGLANKIPGVKIGQAKAPQIPLGGINATANYLLERGSNAFALSGKAFGTMGEDFRNFNSPISFDPSTSGGNNAPDDTADGGKTKKSGKSAAEKEMDKLKEQAKQLKEDIKTPWEWYQGEIEKADKLLKKHLITLDEFNKKGKLLKEELIKKELADVKVEFELKPNTDGFNSTFKAITDKLERDINQQRPILEKWWDDFEKKHEKAKGVIEGTRTALEKYNITVQELNTLLKEGYIDQDTFNRAIKAAKEELNGLNEKFNEVKGFLEDIGRKFEDVFIDTFKTGQFSVKEFFAAILEDLARLIIRLTVIIPIVQFLISLLSKVKESFAQQKSAKSGVGGVLAGIGGSILTSVLTGGLFKGAGGNGFPGGGLSGAAFQIPPNFNLPTRAGGGDLNAGQLSIVGERGKELFVPDTSGTIVSNNELKGLGGQPYIIEQNFHVTANDTRGFKELLAREKKFIQDMAAQGVQQADNRRGRRGPLDPGRGR